MRKNEPKETKIDLSNGYELTRPLAQIGVESNKNVADCLCECIAAIIDLSNGMATKFTPQTSC
jgi:hypothetical protein